MNKRFTAIAGLILGLPLVGQAQASFQVLAESYNPTYTGASESYQTSLSLVSLGGSISSASYTTTNGFTAVGSPLIALPSLVLVTAVDDLDPVDDGIVTDGGTISLSVETDAQQIISLAWSKDGVLIEGATESTLVLAELTEADEGAYTITVTNPAGVVTSEPFMVDYVAAPAITVDLVDAEGVEGAVFAYSIEADSETEASYQWMKDGVAIEGATAATLELADLTVDDEGTYSVEVSNIAGSVMSADSVFSVIEVPTITTDLADVEALEGANVSYTIVADVEGTAAYQWSKDGVAISGATTASLELTAVTGASEGVYSVAVSNEAGSVSSADSTLTVIEVPVILVQPMGAELVIGDSVTLMVDARAEGTAVYAWSKDGVAIAGASTSSLVLADVAQTDAGVYTVEISNEAGSVTSDGASVTVSSGVNLPNALADSTLLSVGEDGTAFFESDWFGTFSVAPDSDFGWVYSDLLGWTYITSISTPQAAYLLPLLVGDILYTNSAVYPEWVFSYMPETWIYMPSTNDPTTGAIWGYAWTPGEWIEFDGE